MESRRRTRRDHDEPIDPNFQAPLADDEGSQPGPLFEGPPDEIEAPEAEHQLSSRDFQDEDLDEEGVVVTHSLPTRYPEASQPAEAPPPPSSEEAAPAAVPHRPGEPMAAGDVGPVSEDGPPQPPQEEPAQGPAAVAAVAAQPEPSPVAEPGPQSSSTRFSPDGEWWWNGAGWLPAVSLDGLWRWDGTRWQLQVASGLEPERLVEGLNHLAEVRYRRRGLLLVQRADFWPVPAHLQQAVDEAQDILEQRDAAERRLRELGMPGGGQQRGFGGLLARVAGAEDDGERLRSDVDNLRSHLDPRLLRIGYEAPRPTFREADEVLETAQHLAESAREVTVANDAVLAAQAEWQARVAAASSDLDQRVADREARIAQAEVRVRDAEARREQRIADRWRHLAAVRMPGRGEHLASFGPFHLYESRIEMPNAAGPTAGARAVIGSAAQLTESEPRALEDLFLVGDGGAADLHWAESNNDATPYLLVVTETGAGLVTCGENEAEARRFARELAAAAATAAAAREERRTRLVEARQAVREAEGDFSETEAAKTARAAVEEDPQLLQAIEEARLEVVRQREDTAEIDQTGTVLQGVLDRLTTAPQPLPTVAAP